MLASAPKNLNGQSWLFVGGAGYIGSHVVEIFMKAGVECVVIDDLSLGNKERLTNDTLLITEDCADTDQILPLLSNFQFHGIVHLAGLKQARESIKFPLKYWDSNLSSLIGSLRLREILNIPNFIFSSSCSVYGSAGNVEDSTPLNPVSTYGQTKKTSEEIIKNISNLQSFNYGFLRYFNVIGASDFPNSCDDSEECLVPNISRRILRGESITIFGNDFSTPDKTAMRDYIDVRDIAMAHLFGANALVNNDVNWIVNVSTGKPISVLEICMTLKEESELDFKINYSGRVLGDPESIWAEPSKKLANWGWKQKFSLRDSVSSHWRNFILNQQLHH